MKNIMKAQLYQLLRSSILYKTFLCLVVFQIMVFVVARHSVLEMEGRAFSAGKACFCSLLLRKITKCQYGDKIFQKKVW